ncbi:MAG: type II toxin-antitoxin system PemK/MazF family toxin [Campylobacterota bacterium]|nr:type II toxin-antitoxin system PemK/MazF family toxin [Campylobacterota bacterium]
MVGNIYLAKIYFTDLSEYKIRPVLVIKELDKDCICLQLTSQFHYSKLKLTNNDLSQGSLKKDSLIVVPKNFTLHKSILFKYIATIKKEKLQNIYKLFCDDIGCNKTK